MTEKSVHSPETDDVITFPVEAVPGAVLRGQTDAITFLEWVKLVRRHWVNAGCVSRHYSPGLDHNVSNTCTVQDDEWTTVRSYIWENRQYFSGLALLPYLGDKLYAQAPREAVVTEEDIAYWNRLEYRPVDYTKLREGKDATSLRDVPACAAGGCEP